jgi:hypothetical protein
LAKRPALVAAGQPAVAAEAAGTDATAAAPAGSAPIPVSVAPARTNAGAAGATMPSFAPAGPAPAAPASTSIPSGAGAGSETIVGPMLDGAAAIVPPVALPDPSTVAGSVAPISVPPIPPLDVGTDPAAGIVPLPGAGTAATGLVGGVLAR